MSGRVWPLVLMAMLALAPVWAQRAGLDPAGLDPANVARASAGDAASEVRVGEAYAAGRGGVTRDLQQAAEWYMRAAEKGDVAGELHLAALYRDGGKGFPRQTERVNEFETGGVRV
jgi:TPR repeat protein